MKTIHVKFLLSLLFVGVCNFLQAQVHINVTLVPSNTPLSDTLFIAGSFNNWQAADKQYMLQKVGSTYQITLPAGSGNAAYKFTRGSWATVEGNSSGAYIPNRTFTYAPNLTINCTIAGWEDKPSSGGGGSTALPQVKIISDNFFMPQLQRSRRIWVYLPNNYESNTAQRYPVLYLQDGQNLFDQKTSFSGEWSVDETLSNLQKLGDKGCIVVGIDNGGVKRLDEYSPFINPTYGGGEGELYVDFLKETLKPYIDSVYRTLTNASQTGIGGSSMGANIALYAAVKYPDVFGKVLAFSPAYWFSDSMFVFISQKPINYPIKVISLAGTNESNTMVPYMFRVDSILQRKGVGLYNGKLQQHVDGAHAEWYWKREFGAAYQWLFSEPIAGLEHQQKSRFDRATTLNPNPADTYTEIKSFPIQRLLVLDISGNIIFETQPQTMVYKLDVSHFPPGLYYIQIDLGGNNKIVKTLLVQHP